MTNSLHIMNEAAALDSNVTLLMPGGTYRKRSASFHGSQAEQAFRVFTFDKLFIGADGLMSAGHHHLQRGISGEPGHVPGGTADHRGDRLQQIRPQDAQRGGAHRQDRHHHHRQGISDADRQALEQHGIQVVLV